MRCIRDAVGIEIQVVTVEESMRETTGCSSQKNFSANSPVPLLILISSNLIYFGKSPAGTLDIKLYPVSSSCI